MPSPLHEIHFTSNSSAVMHCLSMSFSLSVFIFTILFLLTTIVKNTITFFFIFALLYGFIFVNFCKTLKVDSLISLKYFRCAIFAFNVSQYTVENQRWSGLILKLWLLQQECLLSVLGWPHLYVNWFSLLWYSNSNSLYLS